MSERNDKRVLLFVRVSQVGGLGTKMQITRQKFELK